MHHNSALYYVLMCYNINYWYQPTSISFDYAKKGLKACIENGEIIHYASFLLFPLLTFYFANALNKVIEGYSESEFKESKSMDYYYTAKIIAYLCNVLMAKESYDQNNIDTLIHNINKNMSILLAMIYTIIYTYFYIIGNYEEAYRFRKKYEPLEENIRNFFQYYYGKTIHALILVSLYKNMTFLERFSARKQLKKIQKLLKMCSDQQTENFSSHYYLISAEISSLDNTLEKALDLYNKAISSSLSAENWQFAGIANECAAKFLLRMNQSKLAKSYMQEAHYYYSRWEAYAKVKLLEETYPQWFKEERKDIALVDTLSSTTTRTGNLDYLSIIKSTQALSSEIILNKLLEKLMRILLENAGAQRGLLMIEREGKMYIEAEGFSNKEEVSIKDQTIDERTDLPHSLILYVQRTKESIVLADASKDIKFSQDSYIKKEGIKSLICSPILYQNKVMGFIYLENNSTENAFTKDRIEILSILSSQAAISLENARLYVASGKFVPIEFLQLLKKRSLVDVKLGDHIDNKMSVLFLDIRGFTVLSETMTASDNFQFINAFLDKMEPVIRYHDGFIDKYIGDAIMALFKGEKADDALQAAITMLSQLKSFNEEQVKQNKNPIRIGIGINTGDLILGIVGGKQRMESSVIGDTVNIASHIESLTKIYGVPLLISEETKNALTHATDYTFRLIDKVSVKGKKQLVNIWEVLDADWFGNKDLKIETLETFNKAREAYFQQEFDAAKTLFKECLTINPSDSVASFFLEEVTFENN